MEPEALDPPSNCELPDVGARNPPRCLLSYCDDFVFVTVTRKLATLKSVTPPKSFEMFLLKVHLAAQ